MHFSDVCRYRHPLWPFLAVFLRLFNIHIDIGIISYRPKLGNISSLGSSVCKDLETSRVRLFLKHAVPSSVQN